MPPRAYKADDKGRKIPLVRLHWHFTYSKAILLGLEGAVQLLLGYILSVRLDRGLTFDSYGCCG